VILVKKEYCKGSLEVVSFAMDSEQSLAELAKEAGKVVRQVAKQIQSAYGTVTDGEIELKSRNSLVSHVDQSAERALVIGLRAILPEAGFLTEEETVEQQVATHRWIIDPLDGTTNFLHGLPFFSISIALERQGKLVLGIVHEVTREEHFVAWEGGGTWLNGRQVFVSDREQLSDCLVATGFPYYDYQHVDAYLQVLKRFMEKTRGLRRLGSAALDLAYVACGRFDAFYEYALHPWDVAGGIVLVREAGGVVSDFSGDEDTCWSGKEILAANKGVHLLAQKQIKQYF
jgi:myo-inositol-1(or 4)-monophosphatase